MNDIKRRLQRSMDWSSLIDELEAEVEAIADRDEKSRRLYALGQTCEERLLRKDRAMVAYQKAFKLAPQDVRPLTRARQIYHEMGNLRMVAKLFEFELKATTEPRERARRLTDLAMVEIDLGQADAARVRLAEAQALEPQTAGLDEALQTLAFDERSWQRDADQLIDRADAATDAREAAGFLVRAARIYALQSPGDYMTERLLQRAIERHGADATANDLLELLWQQQGRIEEIAALHEARLAQTTGNARDRLCRHFASLWAIRYGDLALAASFYERALQSYYGGDAEPFVGHLAAFALLRQVKGPTGGWFALLDLADAGMSAPLLEEDQVGLAAAAGEIAWKELGDLARATPYFEWLARLDAEHPSLLAFEAALGKPLGAEEPAAEPASAGRELLAAEAPAAAEPAEGEAPRQEDQSPASPRGAAPAAAPPPAAPALAETPATVAGTPATIEAELAEDARGVGERAAATAEAALPAAVPAANTTEAAASPSAAGHAAPASAPALDGAPLDEAVDDASARLFADAQRAESDSLERGITAWRKAAAQARSARTPRRALARLYRQAERWNQLVEVLKEEAELVADPALKRALLLQAAEVYRDQLKLDAMVVNTLAQALKTYEQAGAAADPAGQLELLQLLGEQYERTKRWSDLIGALRRQAELVATVGEKVAIWTQIAVLFLERFSNQAEAIKAFEQVLELDPTHKQALSELKLMYERRRDWDKLITVWQREIDLFGSDAERAAGYLELARLAAAKLKRPQVSSELWGRVLDFAPANLEALEQLEALHERAKEWEQLAAICRRQVEHATDPARKSQLLQKIAVLWSEKLANDAAAIDAWRELLTLEPDNRRAQDALKKLYLAAKAYDSLEQFYAEQNKWEEFIRVLERQVESEADVNERLALHFKIADLWQQRLDKPERAMRAFEKVLALDESNLRAAEALIPLYQGGQDLVRYARALEIQLTHTPSGGLRLERLQQLAELCEESLRDAPRAFHWTLEAFGLDPRAQWARERCERLAAQVGGWTELVTAYEAAIPQLADPSDQLALLLPCARVYELELADVAQALRTNQRLLEIDAQQPQALEALERLYGRTGQWQELLGVLTRKSELAGDAEQRRELYFRSAQIHERELDDLPQAVATYERILALGGDDLRALRALAAINERQQRWGELAETLLRLLPLIPSSEADQLVEQKYRLAQIYELRLDDASRAIEVYRDVLALRRDHTGARAALERHLEQQSEQLEVAAVLEPIYAELEEWHRLADLLEIRLTHQSDPAAKVELLLRIGALLVERIGDGDRAFEAFSRCFRVDPANVTARGELERLAEIQDRLEDLAQLYEQAAQDTLDSALQHELYLRLAEIMDERLEQPERAIEFYRKAQQLNPDRFATLDALERLFSRSERWAELPGIYRRKVDLLADAGQRQQLLARMAYIWEEMLGNVAEAITCHDEILTLDERNVPALKALDRLYQLKQAWPELAENLQRQLLLVGDEPEATDLLLRLASLRESELGELASAVETYREVLGRDGREPTAVAALERLLADARHELPIAQILEPYYKSTADWRNLVRVYEIMVKHAEEPARRIDLLHQIAELHEIAGEDQSGAFAVCGRALRESPSHEPTQQHLERLARQLGAWQALVELYASVVAGLDDESLVVALELKAADVYQQQLGNLDQAAAAYRRVLAVQADQLEAIDALEQIYRRTEAHEQLVAVLLQKATVVLDGGERKQLLYRAAQLEEELLERPEQALVIYRSVLENDPAEAPAIEALERIYTRLERWQDLRDNCQRKLELAEDAREKKRVLHQLAALLEQRLRDPERAIETLQSVLDLDAEDAEALGALDRLFQQGARWQDQLQVLERQVELAPSSAAAVELRHRIARLWERELGDVPRAIETHREVLAIDAQHEPTLGALEALLRGGQEPLLAAQVLEPVYEQALEWGKLVEVYEVVVQHSDDALRRQELLHKIARHRELKLDDGRGAFAALGRAFEQDSGDERAVAELERLAGELSAWRELAALYERELARLADPVRQAELGLRVARVFEEELSEPERAIAHFAEVARVEPENRQAVLALDRLYVATQQYQPLVAVLRREIELAETDDEALALQFRLGRLHQLNLGDVASALECYREILTARPDHRESLGALELLLEEGQSRLAIAAILEPIYRQSEQWSKHVRVMEVQLEHASDAADKVQLVQRIAETYEQRIGDPEQALRWWGLALQFDAGAELVNDELARLARALDQWGPVAGYYREVLPRLQGDQRQQALKVLAKICDEQLSDAAAAEQAYLEVLAFDRDDGDALAALDRIYLAAAAWSDLAGILRRRVALTDSSDAQVQLQLRLAAICADALRDDDAAVAVYRQVLDTDSRNAQALEALERIYFRREQWRELYETYEKQIDIAPGDAGLADCYAQMAKLASDALGDPAQAKELWHRVLDLRGEDPLALEALAALYERAEDWRELVEVLQRQVAVVEGAEREVALQQRLGRIWGEQLGRERNALEAWQRVLELAPDNVPALYAIAGIHREAQAWEELVPTVQRLIDVGGNQGMPDDELRALYAQLGELQGQQLMRPEPAIEAWRQVLRLAPYDGAALDALEQLLTQEARWEECSEVLDLRVEALEAPSAKVEVLLQSASLWQDKLGNTEASARAYERVLQLLPGHDTAFAALEQIYTDGERWEALVELLLGRVEHVAETADSVELLHRVARLYERKLHQNDAAFMVLQAAFKRDYSNDQTVKELERLASLTDRWNELLTECNTIVQTVRDPKTKADLLVNMGLWYGELGHLQYAIPAVQQALQIDPDSRRALDALATFHRKAGRWPELVEVLARSQELTEEPQQRAVLLARIGETFEYQINDPRQAIQAYRKALALDDGNGEVLAALERLYRATEQWEGLIGVLSRQAELADDAERVLELRGKIGALYDGPANDPARAIESYKDMLAMEPHNAGALKALERLYDRTGQTEQYLDVLEAQLDVVNADEDRVVLYQRMATVWDERCNKPERAAECLERVLTLDERHLASYQGLERLYSRCGRWEDLVEAYRRHINAVADPSARIALYLAMGETYERALQDPDRAIEAYGATLSFDPDQTAALSALARLYEQIEAWDRAVDVMNRLVELLTDTAQRVDVLFRLGRIYEQQLDDPLQAEERYVAALELDPSHLGALMALVVLYKARGDWAKAGQLMQRAVERTTNALEQARLLYEGGVVYLEQLGDEATATELFARTLRLDPDHVQAGEPLAQLLYRAGRWAELEPVLEMLLRKADRRNNRRLHELHYRLARTADELKNNDKALKNYRAAFEIDSTDLPTLRGLAALQFRMEEWDRAFKTYQTLLVHHRDTQQPQEVVEVFGRLGQIKLRLGERRKALNMFEKALELDPQHRPSLEAVIEIQTQQNEWEAVITAKRALLERADGEEKFELLSAIAELYQGKLKNVEKAVAALREALAVKPDAFPVLHRLVELYSETKQWKRAVEIILKLAELDASARVRARYYYTAAVISRDEIRSLDDALELFDRSLDATFSEVGPTTTLAAEQFKAFEALDRICTQKKDWKAQERYYRKMIARLPQQGQNEWRVRLWHALGEIYRTRLRSFPEAIAAFEVATRLEPQVMQRHEILAELYLMAGPESYDKAIGEQRTLAQAAPFKAEPYQAMRKIYMELREYDRAWCVCATLAFLKKADEEEQRFFEQYRPRGFVRATARMTEELWRKNVFHPDEDLLVAALLARVAPVVGPLLARPHKQFGLKRKERRDLATDQLTFSKVFNYVTSLLNVAQPELYLQPDRPLGLQLVNTEQTPSFVVGADLLQGRSEKELAFAIGEGLFYLRPEHFLAGVLLTPARLRVAFLAALRLCSPQLPLPPAEQGEVERLVKELGKRLHPTALEELARVVQRFLERRAEVDLAKWMAAVKLSADRVGLVLCNDLEVAAKLISAEASAALNLPAKDRVKELVLYSVSEEYLTLRKELGLVIGTEG